MMSAVDDVLTLEAMYLVRSPVLCELDPGGAAELVRQHARLAEARAHLERATPGSDELRDGVEELRHLLLDSMTAAARSARNRQATPHRRGRMIR